MNLSLPQRFVFLAKLFLLSSPLLGLLWPGPLDALVAGALLPALVHLVTLGFFVPLALAFAYQQGFSWPKLTPVILALWALGLAAFLAGILGQNRWAFYLGGHYAAPGALYLFSAQAARTAWVRRSQKGLGGLGWPILGLFGVVNFGGMLVLDRFYGGKYAFFSPHAVLAHMLAALGLFVLPYLTYRLSPQGANGGQSSALSLGLGTLPLGLYLYGWLGEKPELFALTLLALVPSFLLLAFNLDWRSKTLKLQKTGWLLASLGLVTGALGQGLAMGEAQGILGFGLFLVFGLLVPGFVTAAGLDRGHKSPEVYALVALLLGWALGMGFFSGLPLQPGFAAYLLLGLLWLKPWVIRPVLPTP